MQMHIIKPKFELLYANAYNKDFAMPKPINQFNYNA